MFEKFIVYILTSLDQNASILAASVVGSLVSVFAREERSFLAACASFASGVFAGWYVSQLLAGWVPIPREPLAAVLAIMGRDLVRHILNMGKNNPMFILDFVDNLRGKGMKVKIEDKVEGDN